MLYKAIYKASAGHEGWQHGLTCLLNSISHEVQKITVSIPSTTPPFHTTYAANTIHNTK